MLAYVQKCCSKHVKNTSRGPLAYTKLTTKRNTLKMKLDTELLVIGRLKVASKSFKSMQDRLLADFKVEIIDHLRPYRPNTVDIVVMATLLAYLVLRALNKSNLVEP